MYSGDVSRVNLGKAKELRENLIIPFEFATTEFRNATYIDKTLDDEGIQEIYSAAYSALRSARQIVLNLGLEYRVREKRKFLRFNENSLKSLELEVKGTELEEHVSKVTYNADHVSVHEFSLKLFEYIEKAKNPKEYVSVFLNRHGLRRNGILTLFTYDVFDSGLITKLTTMVDKLRQPEVITL